MKDTVKITSKIENYSVKEVLFASAMHFSIFAVCFLACKSVVLGRLLPFGLGFLAGSGITFLPAAALGGFIGYFIPAAGNSGFRYIAGIFALLAIKLLLSSYKKLVSSPYFSAGIAILVSSFTSAVALKGLQINFIDLLTEALLCGSFAYFTARCFKIPFHKSAGLTHLELAELLTVISILLTGAGAVSLNGVSLGRILGFLLLLIASKYGGVLAGSVSAVALSFSLMLTGTSPEVCVSLAFAGLALGIFSVLGKYVQMLTLLIFSFLGTVSSGDMEIVSRTIIETILACALFLSLPRKLGIYIGKVVSSGPRLASNINVKKSVAMRLELASGALSDVSQTVEQVSKELSKINSPDFSRVLMAVEQDACSGCKLRVHCWESRRDDTINAILEMTKAVKQGECSPEIAAPDEFKGRCLRNSRVGNATYKRYSDYASRIAAENRIDEVRSVVSEQFSGISEMLYDLSLDFKADEQFDSSAAEIAVSALKGLDIRVSEAAARIDKFGRMTLEFKLKKTPELVINKLGVMKTLSVACERDFDIPQVSETGGDIFITINEYAALRVDFGAEQICADGSSMCGDAYKYFYDGRGHFIMVLSDGMGTGGRAAVDGAMASGLMSRLLKAGFGYDCSLRILNSSMLFKSTDESLATVDIASVDLYTGDTYLYKAGAAPTLVRRSGRTGKAESRSLPAGILKDIGFDRATLKCKTGDIILLMSDGVCAEGTDWIRAELEAWQNGSAQELAERIGECARRRASADRRDDITVLTAILEKRY